VGEEMPMAGPELILSVFWENFVQDEPVANKNLIVTEYRTTKRTILHHEGKNRKEKRFRDGDND
jgi:hypothetical protein